MNIRIPSLLVVALFCFAPLFNTVASAISPITLTVRMVNAEQKKEAAGKKAAKAAKSGKPGKKGAGAKPPEIETDSKKLEISLRNSSNQEVGGLTVKYYFFGREVGTTGAIIVGQGELTAAVPAGKTNVLETEVVSAQYSSTGSQKLDSGKIERIKASGKKITGYGTQVLQGTEVIAEYFSSFEYKKLVSE